jgi:hypothetical protein
MEALFVIAKARINPSIPQQKELDYGTSVPGISKQPTGHIHFSTCVCMAYQLRMAFTF